MYPPAYRHVTEIITHYRPVGCDACFYTGYKGRQAIYEVIGIDHELAEKIKIADLTISKKKLVEKGVTTLSDNAFQLFKEGKTTIEEIYSLLYSA